MSAAVLACAAALPSALAQSTAFTYQGQLDDSGVPADGLYDLQFRLFDAAVGGLQVGATVCLENIDVVGGIFTVVLDFGQQFAVPSARHMSVSVRRDTGLTCANSSGFVALLPRQQLTATPLSNHAKSAFALDAADGSPTNAVFVDNSGNVGIGTATPTSRLDVRGGPIQVENLGNQADLLWLASERSWVFRQEGTGVGTSLKLESIGGGGNKNFIIQTTGNVGIGTTTPLATLHARSDLPVAILQDSGPNSTQSGYYGFWNSSGSETGWIGFGTPGSPHMSMVNARAGGKIQLFPGAGGAVTVPVLEITGADLAEKFPASETLEPGMVAAIDPNQPGKLCLARGAYNKCVAGVVSGANDFSAGAVLGNLPGHEDAPPIALSGRVYVYCDASSVAIAPGDMLTTSDTPGHAMKAADASRLTGTVIGKAMSPLAHGDRGLVLVLVNLQ
ncbi:MAG: hypothetical protein AB7N71_06440 [Phycisphaerae bacterium]